MEDSDLEEAARDLFAIERDRLLGYPPSELHMTPAQAVQNMWDILVEMGYNPDELIVPEEQDTLEYHNGICRPDTETKDNE